MFEQRPTEPKPNSSPWPGVIIVLSAMALIAWALWLLLGQ